MHRLLVLTLVLLLIDFIAKSQNTFNSVKIADTVEIRGYLIGVSNKEKQNIDQYFSIFFLTNEEFDRIKKLDEDKLFELEKNRDSIFVIPTGPVFEALNSMILKYPLPTIPIDSLPIPNGRNNYKKSHKKYYSVWKVKGEFLMINLDKGYLKYLVDLNQYHFTLDSISVFIFNSLISKDKKTLLNK